MIAIHVKSDEVIVRRRNTALTALVLIVASVTLSVHLEIA